jgi:hypothetical protein
MLEISEDQNLDLNSGARQRLLAHEQLSFTLAVDDDGTDYSGQQRHHTPLNLGCCLGQGILVSKSFQAEQLDHLAQGRRKGSAQGRRKDLLKAAGRICSRPREGSAQGRGNPGRQYRRSGNPSRCQIMPPRRAIAADRGNPYRLRPGLASTDTSTLFTMLYSGFKFRNQRTPNG